MLFNSYQFILVFLPLTVTGYWLLVRHASGTIALLWLTVCSIAFYAYGGGLHALAVTSLSILVDYLIACAIVGADSQKERFRQALFIAGIAANIVFLGYFKYKNFLFDTSNDIFGSHVELEQIVLPLGISFLVFQKIAFLADVWSGQVQRVRLADFLLFSFFFPRTVAGPIVHYSEILPPLLAPKQSRINDDLIVGICLFSMGLFKKSVLADGISKFVALAFVTNSAAAPAILDAWFGVIAYMLQLYFDFSGYSDMALGTARMLGVRLPMNFNSPFRSSSIIEFWSRWHISLTRFLTAYCYNPIVLSLTRRRIRQSKPVLRGKRSSLSAIGVLIVAPTLVTMILSGLWHGADWNFVAWGGLHGIYLVINQVWRILRPRLWPDNISYEKYMKPVGQWLTLLAVVAAIVLFRAPSFDAAFGIYRGMLGMNGILPIPFQVMKDSGIIADSSVVYLKMYCTVYKYMIIWIALLLAAVLTLPNSLELLRRYQPAQDFPLSEGQPDTDDGSPTKTLLRLGPRLNRITVTGAAILFVIAFIALRRGSGFLYGQF